MAGPWSISSTSKLSLEDFRQALDLTGRIGELAEAEGHHPEILLGWGKVRITNYTHKIKGLTESDFVLAAKIDELVRRREKR